MAKIKINETVFVLIDQQERLVKAMDDIEKTTERQLVMLKGAVELKLDTIITEQYPKGLGSTIQDVKAVIDEKIPIIEKTAFSAFGESRFRSELRHKTRKNMIIAGIESHVCVLQTAIDAINDGYQIFILADGVTSRKSSDKKLALKYLKQAGAKIVSTEMMLFMLIQDAKHPSFKAISNLIK